MRTILIKTVILSLLYLNMTFAYENCEEPLKEIDLVEAYNPPFNIKCKETFFFSLSFIYWQPIEDGLNLAFIKESSNNSTIKTDFEYKPGFKIGLGFNTHYDNWVLSSGYTRLSSHDHARKEAAGDESIYPLWIASMIDSLPTIGSNAKGQWDLEFNLLDLNLGRPYFVGSKMVFNPFIGLRTLWIDQEYLADYQLTSPFASLAKRTVKSDSWGIGAKIGVDLTYLVYKGFKIIGNGSASLFFQHYDLSTKFLLQAPNTADIQEVATDKTSHLTPNIDASLGLGWGSNFFDDKMHFDLFAMYEFQIFWNQNMLRSFKDLMTNNVDGASGDLMFQGLTLTARLDF